MSLQFEDGADQTWEEVRSDAEETNWMLLGYDESDRNKIVHVGKGTGGHSEFLEQLTDDAILYGAFRVTAVDDDSRRTKFVFVCWIGSKVSPLKRARVSTHKSAFEGFFKGHHVSITTDDKDDMSQAELETRLNNSTGAHKPKHYEF